MRIEKTVETNGRHLQVTARVQTRKNGERVWRVRVSERHYFRDLAITNCSSADEAVDSAVAMYLGTEGSRTMKRENVKVGQEYTLKVGRNEVKAVAVTVPAEGVITVKTVATHKTLKVADPARLKPVSGGQAAAREEGAPVDAASAETPKRTRTATKRTTGEEGATQPREKRTSLMDAAVKVLQEADQADLPMSAKKMADLAMSKGYWFPARGGKTPAGTLYAMILRDVQKHGGDAKFRRAEDHFGRGMWFLQR